MSFSINLVTLALLWANASCLPGPDPRAYHFSKTVGTTEKAAPSYDLELGNFEKPIDNNIKLVGGGSSKEGNVLLNGKPICDDFWDNRDAKVVCRMLGFSSDGAYATTQSQFGNVSGAFIMDDVQCKGAETHINDCYYSDKHNCGAGEGAGVRCRESPLNDDLKEDLEEIKDENEELRTKLSALMTKLDGLSSNLTELQGTVITNLISSSDDISEHISSFNDSLTSLATSVNDHETKLSSHHDQIHSVIVKTASNSKNIEDISTVVDGHKTKVHNVTQDVVNLKDLNIYRGKWCGYQDSRTKPNSRITYDSLTYSSSNMDITVTPLDINNGVFTVPVSGTWRVTYSWRVIVDSGEVLNAYIYLNGTKLKESLYWGYSGNTHDVQTGGRVVTLKANVGNTIDLRTADGKGEADHIYFCVAFEHGPDQQSRLSAGDEDILSPEYQDRVSAGHDKPRSEYQDNFYAGDEEYFSSELEKSQSSCSSNADCPPHLACISSVLSSDPGTCGDPWCWREEWDCGSRARCTIVNHKPMCL